MADESSQEKTESPTEKRREDARKEGQVAFSKEVSASAILGMFLVLFYFIGGNVLEGMEKLWIYTFENLNYSELSIPFMQNLMGYYMKRTVVLFFPFFVVAFATAILASVMQVGVNITFKPLVPKPEKISPLKGFGRFFSKQTFNELIKSILKLVLIGYIGYVSYEENIATLSRLTNSSMSIIIHEAFSIVGVFCLRLFLALATMAMFDFMFQKWDLEQKLKMSKQDVKEEHKQMEGDPQLKAKIKQIQQKMSQARMMQDVPESDVVISNPTHYAIALKYDREVAASPLVMAKGSDYLALRIMDVAKKSDVPIIRNPPVARGMYQQVEIGDEIPEDFYKAVAEILAFVYKSKRKR